MGPSLISGVTGQDGRYLARHLVRQGASVVGTTRGDAESASRSVESFAGGAVRVVKLDPCDPDAVARVLTELRPERVYHLAGQTSVGRSFAEPLETFRSLALSTLHFLEAVRLHRPETRFLVAGSGEAFGDTGGVPADETFPLVPSSPYAVAKAAVHQLVANYRTSYGLFACTAILYNHESPLRPPSFFTRKVVRAAIEIAQGRRNRVKLGSLDVERDFGWAEEYMVPVEQMLSLASPEDFVLASGSSHSLRDFVERVFGRLGLDIQASVEFDAGLLRKNEVAVMRGNPAKAARLLNFRAKLTLDDIVDRLIAAEEAATRGRTDHA